MVQMTKNLDLSVYFLGAVVMIRQAELPSVCEQPPLVSDSLEGCIHHRFCQIHVYIVDTHCFSGFHRECQQSGENTCKTRIERE